MNTTKGLVTLVSVAVITVVGFIANFLGGPKELRCESPKAIPTRVESGRDPRQQNLIRNGSVPNIKGSDVRLESDSGGDYQDIGSLSLISPYDAVGKASYLPETGLESGLFSSTEMTDLLVNEGMLNYDPRSPLREGGSPETRYLASAQ